MFRCQRWFLWSGRPTLTAVPPPQWWTSCTGVMWRPLAWCSAPRCCCFSPWWRAALWAWSPTSAWPCCPSPSASGSTKGSCRRSRSLTRDTRSSEPHSRTFEPSDSLKNLQLVVTLFCVWKTIKAICEVFCFFCPVNKFLRLKNNLRQILNTRRKVKEQLVPELRQNIFLNS